VKNMNVLRLVNLLVAILLMMVALTASWIVCDTYNKYGWSYEVTTIIKGETETKTETVVTMILISTVIWLLAFVNLVNFFKLESKK